MTQRCCLMHPIKQSCLLKSFLGTLILITQAFLCLHSLLKLKLYNVPATHKLVKKVIPNLDSSKACYPVCIPMVVLLKKCGPESFYILAEFFSMCLKDLVFQIVERSRMCSFYLRMLGRGPWLKGTALLVFFF